METTALKEPKVKTTKAQKKTQAIQTELNLSTTEPSTGCCKGTPSCTTKAIATQPATTVVKTSSSATKSAPKPGQKTRITVKHDVGYNNHISIRGSGANLSWDRGAPLKNVKSDEWVWETEVPFSSGEFKVLINDSHYETGENHPLKCGSSVQYTPKF